MNDKSTQPEQFLFQKEGGHAFSISGKDARRYLNNRLTQDISSLRPGRSSLAAALTPKGRCEGLFTIICQQEDQFIAYCDDGLPADSVAAFKRFLVSEQLQIENLQNQSLYHIAAQNLNAVLEQVSPSQLAGGELQEGIAMDEQPQVRIAMECFLIPQKRTSLSGVDILGGSQKVQTLISILAGESPQLLSPELQVVERIRAGRPEFPKEVSPNRIFSEFGLHDAISFQKGCYPGQEVIERADAKGRLPKKLIRLRLNGIVNIDQEAKVFDEKENAIGSVLSFASDSVEYATYAFALVANREEISEDSQLTIAGSKASQLTIAGVKGEPLSPAL